MKARVPDRRILLLDDIKPQAYYMAAAGCYATAQHAVLVQGDARDRADGTHTHARPTITNSLCNEESTRRGVVIANSSCWEQECVEEGRWLLLNRPKVRVC
jgi:hypothetical protein